MFKVSHYTSDPTLADAEFIQSWDEADLNLAKMSARKSSYGIYVAVYAEDGEQLAGFQDEIEVY